MGEVKELQDKIEAKLRVLDFTEGETSKILEGMDVKAIERHGSALESIVDKVHELKLRVRELRLENDDSPEDVRSWSETLEGKVSKFENMLKKVRYVAAEIKSHEEEKFREEKRKRMLDEQMELEKMKLEVRAKFENSVKGTSGDCENLLVLERSYQS